MGKIDIRYVLLQGKRVNWTFSGTLGAKRYELKFEGLIGTTYYTLSAKMSLSLCLKMKILTPNFDKLLKFLKTNN